MKRAIFGVVTALALFAGCGPVEKDGGNPPPPPDGCQPLTCGDQWLCGSIDNRCGGVIDCGRCPDGMQCVINEGESHCLRNPGGD